MHITTSAFRRFLQGAVLGLAIAACVVAAAPALASPAPLVLALQQGQPAPAGDGFEPVGQLPAREQLPAAPMVMAAYSIVWILTMAFVVSVWRRLGTVERELREVEQRVSQATRRS